MVKDKKGGHSNQNANKNKNVKKDSPHNPRNKEFNRKGNNPKNTQKRRGQDPGSQFQLPPLKNKPVTTVQSQQLQVTNSIPVNKKVQTAKVEQVQDVLVQLQALQGLLNSYEQLQMDENDNIKELIEIIMQKKQKMQ